MTQKRNAACAFVIVILFCMMTTPAFAQSGPWTIYNPSNSGLPSVYVRAIAQENDSVMWIGTAGGLARFDGTAWTVFTTSNSGLPANEVRAILIDGHQKWLGTLGGGVAMYNDTTWTVYNSANSPLPSDYILSMEFDCANNLWIGATYGGATHFDRLNNTWVSYNTTNSGIISNNIRSIYARDSADVWFGNLGGLSHFQNSVWTVYDTANSPLPYDDVRDIREDSVGNLWIGTYSGGGPTGGIAKYDGTNWTIYDTSNTSMLANSVGTILIDPCGNVWCGNYYLNRFDGTNWMMYDTASSPLPGYNVGIIVEDCQGDIWVGTLDGGVARFHNDCSVMPDCTPHLPYCTVITGVNTSIESKSEPMVYPNPASGILNVELSDEPGCTQYLIYSVTGCVVSSGQSASGSFTVEISELPEGTYILETIHDSEVARTIFTKL